jgi:RNA polymerase subunit RPABC4/transcription elongation factor Spt4
MGHALFIALHLVAAFFVGLVLLFITIPMHLIYGVLRARHRAAGLIDNPATQVRCPACRELVRHDASLCKHCGSALQPVALPTPLPEERYGLAIAIATLVLMVAAAKACT